MKKLLVLTLVLGIASLASATLTLSGPLSVNVGETISITITEDDTDASAATKYLVISDTTKADFDVPSLGGVDYPYPLTEFGSVHIENAGAEFASFSWTPTATGGNVGGSFVFQITGAAAGAISLSGIDAQTGATVVDPISISITEIPEPATMAILGLGALLLRRKK